MATFNFNALMQQAKSASFDPLPIGDYDAECISADAVTSSTGKPMIKCKFEVITGPHAKRKFFNQFVLSTDNEIALAMFFRHMKAFGMDENFFTAVGSGGLGPVAQTLLGRRARFTLGIRKWNEEDRNEVKAVKPMAGGVAAGPGGLPGTGTPSLPGLPTGGGLPTSAPAPIAPPVVQPVAPAAVAQPVAPAPTPPPAAAPVAPAQNGTPAVAQPVPPAPAAVAEPAPPVAPPQPPVQPVEVPAPVQAPVQQPVQPVASVQPVAPVQPEPQPVPPVEQQAAPVGAPAVAPPPPMPF